MPAESGERGGWAEGPGHHRDPSPLWAGKVCQFGIRFVFDSRKSHNFAVWTFVDGSS